MSSTTKSIRSMLAIAALGAVVATLQRTGEPVLLEKGRKSVTVLISLRDFHQPLVKKAASEERDRILEEMGGLARESVDTASAVEILRGPRRSPRSLVQGDSLTS